MICLQTRTAIATGLVLLALSAAGCGEADEGLSAPDASVDLLTPTTTTTTKRRATLYELAGERCLGTVCSPYRLFLDRDGTFEDSANHRGTFRENGGRLELWFGAVLGGTVLQANNLDCWDTPPPGLNPAIGLINTCLAATPLENIDHYGNTCFPSWYTSPSVGENGHWAAAGIEPAQDFTVHSVRYQLWNDGGACLAGLPHRVRVYTAAAGAAPDAVPTVLAEAMVDLDQAQIPVDEDIQLHVPLPNKVAVPAGTRAYVAVEMIQDGMGGETCISMCDTSYDPATNFWSGSDTTPYPWSTMESFGPAFQKNFKVGLRGWYP